MIVAMIVKRERLVAYRDDKRNITKNNDDINVMIFIRLCFISERVSINVCDMC